jgi:COP9 signalosome complex subunit 1
VSTHDFKKHEEIAGKLKFELDKRNLPYDIDENWVTTYNNQNRNYIDRLDQELQNYKSNLIKESIRMGHNEFAEKYYSMGFHFNIKKGP